MNSIVQNLQDSKADLKCIKCCSKINGGKKEKDEQVQS